MGAPRLPGGGEAAGTVHVFERLGEGRRDSLGVEHLLCFGESDRCLVFFFVLYFPTNAAVGGGGGDFACCRSYAGRSSSEGSSQSLVFFS